jgi:uncharacterized SAM-binding protein YcdF (DUF218 family)
MEERQMDRGHAGAHGFPHRWDSAINGSWVLRVLGIAAVLLFVLSAFTPLPNLLDHWTEIPAQLVPAEAIVMLAGGVNAQGVLNESSLRLTLHGILLYRQGFAPRLVFSGPANKQGVVEAEIRAEMARQLGIAPTAILTESRVHTTREEAARLAGLLQPLGIRTILLVTNQEHMPRSQPLFEHVGFTVHPAPVDTLSQAAGPGARLQLTRQVLQEFLARLYYRLAGYL